MFFLSKEVSGSTLAFGKVLAATLGSPSAGLRYHGSDLSTKLKLLGVTWYFRGLFMPRGSMYGIFTYIYHKFKPNVGTYLVLQGLLYVKCLERVLNITLNTCF